MTQAQPSPAKPLIRGVTFWTCFAVVAVLLRGVRWDENYEFAQAMDPAFGYPEGHPLFVYVRNVYNVQFYASGLAALLTDSAGFLNGLRNIAFVLATVLPPFLLGAIVSRRALVGHVCALFVLAGVHLEFDGSYPQFVWPGMFSNGHVGTGFAIATVALFAGGYLRTASFMLGLMPMVHLGQTPPLLLLAAVFGSVNAARRNWEPVKSGMPYLAAALALSVGFYALQRTFAVPPADAGPYAGLGPASEIWLGLVQFHDMHRQIPVGNSHFVPLLMAPLVAGGSRFVANANRAWNWVTIYAAGVAFIVYGIMAVQLAMGADTPYLLIGWLPYRLANQFPILLIAMSATVLAVQSGRSGYAAWLLPAFVAFLVVRPALGLVSGAETFSRYFNATDSVLYAMAGAAIGRIVAEPQDARLWRAGIAAAYGGIWLVIAYTHQFGAACAAVGTGLAWVLTRHFPMPLTRDQVWNYATGSISALLLSVVLLTESLNRSHLPVGELERETARYLSEHGEPRAMLVAPPYQLMLQAQTGHPVMSDMATHYHASYMPSLGPTVQRMHRSIYGIDLTRPESQQPGWQAVWSSRPTEEWIEIAEAFDFDYVIAPNELKVRLVELIPGPRRSLYRVPRRSAAQFLPSPPMPVESGASDGRPAGQTTVQD